MRVNRLDGYQILHYIGIGQTFRVDRYIEYINKFRNTRLNRNIRKKYRHDSVRKDDEDRQT